MRQLQVTSIVCIFRSAIQRQVRSVLILHLTPPWTRHWPHFTVVNKVRRQNAQDSTECPVVDKSSTLSVDCKMTRHMCCSTTDINLMHCSAFINETVLHSKYWCGDYRDRNCDFFRKIKRNRYQFCAASVTGFPYCIMAIALEGPAIAAGHRRMGFTAKRVRSCWVWRSLSSTPNIGAINRNEILYKKSK